MAIEVHTGHVPIDSLKPFPGNARRGDVEAIRESLRTHGQYKPIIVQESTGYILAGNHTWEAAREEAYPTIWATFIDVDDTQAKQIVLVDNRTNDLAVYDDRALADLLDELDSLEGTGFDRESVDSLLATLGPGGFSKKEKERVIDPPADPVTKLGDVIRLGIHQLYCADALEIQVGEADMAWTDPPYMVSYQTGLSREEATALHRRIDGKEITNEDLQGEEADAWAWRMADVLRRTLRPGGVYYVHAPPGPDVVRFIEALNGQKLPVRQVLQWVKDRFVFGRSDYHYRSEPMLYGWREGAAHYWCGDRDQDSVWEVKRPKASKAHPTMKPVELAERAIANSSAPGDTVFDPFAGSGTVLVAAMEMGRRAVMVEIDPAYCDVIVERWERLTGQVAERVRA